VAGDVSDETVAAGFAEVEIGGVRGCAGADELADELPKGAEIAQEWGEGEVNFDHGGQQWRAMGFNGNVSWEAVDFEWDDWGIVGGLIGPFCNFQADGGGEGGDVVEQIVATGDCDS